MALFLLAVGQRHILLCDRLNSLGYLPIYWQCPPPELHNVETESGTRF